MRMNQPYPPVQTPAVEVPVVVETPPPGMLLHCGGQVVDRDTVFDVPTPFPTDTWFPLPHHELINEVEGQLVTAGFDITGEAHGLSHDGARYFGVLGVTVPGQEDGDRDYSWIVGLRNSHDKSIPAGLVAGVRVLVCDNKSFTGEVRISRKHTKFAARDLRHLTSRAVGQLGDRFRGLDQRISAYRGFGLTDMRAHDLVVRAVDCRAITTSQVPEVLSEWRQPPHAEFQPRTAWSLFNACTEALKGINPHTAVARSQALHGLFDGLVGLS